MRAQIFNASAGSGKTYRLAYKYVRDVISEPLRYRHILAVTFTNKATEEMKSRILREINTLASGDNSPYMADLRKNLKLSEETIRQRATKALRAILHDYSRFTVLTIDTFFQRILRAFIQELGLDLSYNIEIESSTILTQSADSLVEQITNNSKLKDWLLGFIEERIADGKRWDIQDGILSLSRELLSESNRDTLDNAPSRDKIKDVVSAVILRSKRSKEEYAKLGQRAMQIITQGGGGPEDFKGASNSFAKTFDRIAKGETEPLKETFRGKRESESGWCTKKSPAEGKVPQLLPILNDICDHYDSDVQLWNTATLLRENYRSFALLSDLYERVQEMCKEQNMMLLSETKLILAEFIKGNDTPFIYEKSGNRYERFMIDEFQDTSVKEWQNFLPLLQNAMAQSEDSTVLLVGDIKQSIYRWRGGDWRILHSEALAALGEESTEVETMQDNYRSLPLIVNFNNGIIDRVVRSENEYLNNLIDGKEGSAHLKNILQDAYHNHSQIPHKESINKGFVEVTTFEDEPPIKERIKDILNRGFSPSDIMILTRTNTDGVKIANMLLEFNNVETNPRYKFDVMTREALIIGNSPVSIFVIANMKLALNENDLSQLAIYNNFLGYENFDEPLSEEDLQMFSSIRLKSLEELFEEIVMYHHLDQEAENIAYLQAIHEQLLNFSTSRIGDVSLFVEWWEQKGSQKSLSVEHSDSAIEITTIHKAKGLEKRVVIIPYCNWSLNPKSSGESANIVWAKGEAEVEELGSFPVRFKAAMGVSQFSREYYQEMVYSHIDNVNLLYVALTRAVESLHIFIPCSSTKTKSKLTNSRIGDVLLANLTPYNDKVVFGDELEGEVTNKDNFLSITFGTPSSPEPQGRVQERSLYKMDRYPTSKCDLRLRLPSQRYAEDSEQGIDARHLGVLMHKVFEESKSSDDIFVRLEQMLKNGHISESEHTILNSGIISTLANTQVKEWFSGEWDEVRNENDIIVPHASEIRRPDRVMIRGCRAIVVDYKFGELHPSSHKRQVGGYMKLLKEMGYTQIEGYVWYIKSGEIVEV